MRRTDIGLLKPMNVKSSAFTGVSPQTHIRTCHLPGGSQDRQSLSAFPGSPTQDWQPQGMPGMHAWDPHVHLSVQLSLCMEPGLSTQNPLCTPGRAHGIYRQSGTRDIEQAHFFIAKPGLSRARQTVYHWAASQTLSIFVLIFLMYCVVSMCSCGHVHVCFVERPVDNIRCLDLYLYFISPF